MRMICPSSTVAESSSSPPFALTEIMFVSSRKGVPDTSFPWTNTDTRRSSRLLRRECVLGLTRRADVLIRADNRLKTQCAAIVRKAKRAPQKPGRSNDQRAAVTTTKDCTFIGRAGWMASQTSLASKPSGKPNLGHGADASRRPKASLPRGRRRASAEFGPLFHCRITLHIVVHELQPKSLGIGHEEHARGRSDENRRV